MKHTKAKYIVILFLFFALLLAAVGSSAWNLHVRIDQQPGDFDTVTEHTDALGNKHSYLSQYVNNETADSAEYNGKTYPSYVYGGKGYRPTPLIYPTLQDSSYGSTPARDLAEVYDYFVYSYTLLARPHPCEIGEWNILEEPELQVENGTSADAPYRAGAYKVTIKNTHPNYGESLGVAEQIYLILPKTATFTINAQETTYGDQEAELDAEDTDNSVCAGDDISTLAEYSIQNPDEGVAAAAEVTHRYAGTYIIVGEDTSTDYAITFVEAEYVVTPRYITVQANDLSGVSYGDELPSLTASVTEGSVATGDDLYALIGLSAHHLGDPTTPFTVGNPVGEYNIALAAQSAGVAVNYVITTQDGTLSIDPRAITVTIAPSTSTYGDTIAALSGSVTVGSIFGTDSPYALQTVAKQGNSVGTYAITGTSQDTNYAVTFVDGTYTVTARPITVTIANASSIYLDPIATLSASVTVGSIYGSDSPYTLQTEVKEGDPVANYPITGTATDTNYAVTFIDGVYIVRPRPIIFTAANPTITYGQAAPAYTFSPAAPAGINVSISCTYVQTAEGGAVGDYPITLTATDTTGNYTTSVVHGTLTVAPATLTVTGGTFSTTYGEAAPTLSGAVTGAQYGQSFTATYTTTYTVGNAVGSYPVTPSLTASSNYTVKAVNGTLTVSARPITVTIAPATSAYGSPIADLSASVTAGTVYGTDSPYTLQTAAKQSSPVGSYAITGTAASANYAITFVDGTYSVTAQAITVTIAPASSAYGEPLAALSASVTSGSLYGSDVPYSLQTAAKQGDPIGTYPITGTATNTNYTVTFADGTYTVTARPITVTISAASSAYGDAISTLSASVTTGSIYGTDTPYSLQTTAVQGSSVGTYPITGTATDANYSVTFVDGTYSITARPITVTVAAASSVYGNAISALSASVTTGSIYGTGTPYSLQTTAIQGSSVGTYPITGPATDTNYAITFVNGTYSVTARSLTATWTGEDGSSTDFSWVYDGTAHCPSVTVSGVLSGDTVTVSATGAETNASDGNYFATAVLSGASAANYIVSAETAQHSFQITRKPIDKPAASGTSFVYNGASQYAAMLDSIVGYDTATMSITAFNATNAGTHNFVFVIGSNYMWSDGTTANVTVQISMAKAKVRVVSGLIECTYTDYTTGVPLSFLEKNLMATTTCSATLAGSATYSNGTVTATLTSSGKITTGNTYKITYTLSNTQNLEFSGTNVCYLKYKTALAGGTYYTIEDAITLTTSNIVLAGGSQVVTAFTALDYYGTTDYTIASGRTLLVPHQSGITYGGTATDGGVYLLSQESEKTTSRTHSVYSALEIPAGIHLTVDGSLGIGSVLLADGRVYEHGVIMNEGTVTINGALHAFGYLKSATGTGSVILNSSANAIEVFRVYDYKGGRNTYGISDIFPFNSYSIHNISCPTTIYAGATYSAKFFEVISASILGTRNVDKNVVVVGAGGIFELSDGYVVKSATNAIATPSDTNLTTLTGSNQKLGQRDKIVVCGTATDNSITIEEKVMSMGISITTGKDFPLPLSYMDLEIGNGTDHGTVNLNNVSYYVLPGASIIVNKGSTLNVGSGVTVYVYTVAQMNTDYTKPTYVYTQEGTEKPNNANYGFPNYCIDKEYDAFIQVDGCMNVAGNIGGKITTTKPDATLNISGTTSASIKILATLVYSSSSLSSSATYATSTITANANVDGTAGSSLSAQSYVSVGSGSSAYWTPASAFSSYTLVLHYYGTTQDSSTRFYQGTAPTLTPDDMGVPVRDFYQFDGWFTDESCTSAFSSFAVTDGSTLELWASWTPISYNVSYNLYSDKLGGTLHPASMNNSGSSTFYTAESALVLKAPSATGANGEMEFDGWYLYNPFEGTYTYVGTRTVGTAGTTYGGYVLGTDLTDIVLYGVLKDVAKYTLIYNAQSNKDSTDWVAVHTTSILDGDTVTNFFDVAGTYNYDATYPFYFSEEWYTDEACTKQITSSTVITSALATNGTINLYTKRSSKSTITVSFVNYPGATAASTTYYVLAGGTASVTLPTPSRNGYSFKGWNAGTSIADNTRPVSNTLASAGESVTLSANATYHGVWLQAFSATVTTSNAEVTGVTNGATYEYGQELTISISFSESNSLTYTIKGTSATLDGAAADKTGSAALSSYTCYVKGAVSVNASSSCLATGTLITMADGTQVPIEELEPGAVILSYDFETGTYVPTIVAEVTNHGSAEYEVLTLVFDDESTINIILSHGFFDITLMRYLDITLSNYESFIGHEFMAYDGNDGTVRKTLTSGYVHTEITSSYSLTAAVHINAIADGLVTVTPPMTNWYNMFEVDENLKWDEEKMAADLELYGVFTYDEVADLIPYEIFVASNFRYFKVAMGKGLVTMEELEEFITWYNGLIESGDIVLGDMSGFFPPPDAPPSADEG
ncbi:MAG: InlB B-repeat-containing protein [Clostridia bacterium]|nr:InlB B-repeat-containing protein [Clostridia bacterium]